jgi:hypothetical protein
MHSLYPGDAPPPPSTEERLERGEVVHYPVCPFPLPAGDDRAFLLGQRMAGRAHKNIGYDPLRRRLGGFARQAPGQADRLRGLLADFSAALTHWLAGALPRYAGGWRLDRVSYRPEQEAGRVLRQTARNDLLHVDAFPSRPTNGWRILRVFANLNPSEPRVWITGEPFARLLERYGEAAGLPGRRVPLLRQCKESLLRLVVPAHRRRSAYDAFMLRFHNYLKCHARFQETTPRRRWEFMPGSAWMVLTDTASHAVLGGRFALEHSFFLDPATLVLPEESPPALLRKACRVEVLRRAA